LITLNATADVVHRHDFASSPLMASASADIAAINSADLPNDNSTSNPLKTKDCPVCQLHKHLSNGLVCEPIFSPAPTVLHSAVSVVSAPYVSTSGTPRRGRAPPQTSLL
jgi:hypothetical protein